MEREGTGRVGEGLDGTEVIRKRTKDPPNRS